MREVIADSYEELELMVEQNKANYWYKTGQEKVIVVLYSPLFPVMKLLGMKTEEYPR